MDYAAFIARYADSVGERANKDSYLKDLCTVLGLPHPEPSTGDAERDAYVFEKDAKLAREGASATTKKIDLYKAGCFILEAKQGSNDGAKKLGTARRGTPAWNIAMNDAYGQALGYARAFAKAVPFLIVSDLGHCFDIYAAFDGSWDYRPFPNPQASRIYVSDLEKHAPLLRTIWTDPLSLDPAKQSAKVTREVAEYLANLAKLLESQGHAQESVAKFLMRCLFTMFAEDVGLLPKEAFTKALRDYWEPNPASFTMGVEVLWRTMNDGGGLFTGEKILRFNGGLFRAPSALPLDRHALMLLRQAAECNWTDVEPAIFGTLLERALDPKERHRLGAHYTPRAYVERLVKPTVEEPLRADWDVVRAHVRELVKESEEKPKVKEARLKEARAQVLAFQEKLCKTRVLDPACGSGNFLYVTLDLFKRLEAEVLELRASLGESQELLMGLQGLRVTPGQFLGIEVKPWAKEIAELVLWIGYLQWHFRQYGKSKPVPEPVLQDYGNIECRDAVLDWDGAPHAEVVRDAAGKPVTRWDGETMKVSPVTGKEVPDESATVPVYAYPNPRKATWPDADFIVGNPPFIGNKRMRAVLGEGYVEALRSVWNDVSDSVDFVMYWWHAGAKLIASGRTRRAGLITTNSITQVFNRSVVEDALRASSLAFAVPDHPWVDHADGAQVRIAMTVLEPGISTPGTFITVVDEKPNPSGGGDAPSLEFSIRHGQIHADIATGADAGAAARLRSNDGLSFMGVTLSGQGFVIEPDEIDAVSAPERVFLRPYLVGNELNRRSKGRLVVDLFGLSEADARSRCPGLYQRLVSLVKPERDLQKREAYRKNWWLFAEGRGGMRKAIQGLRWYVAICRTAKFFVFHAVEANVLAESKVVAIALESWSALGILSSRVHDSWARRVGSHHGVGNDLTYNNSKCFATFPFPHGQSEASEAKVASLAESLDAHRKRQQALHPDLTITGMYNVLEKLRSGEALSAKDKVIHEQGLVSVLKTIHDDLDAAVFEAYGWPTTLTDDEILERLVALNKERAEEESRGLVRWLRPDFQAPKGTASVAKQETLPGAEPEPAEDDEAPPPARASKPPTAAPWPKKLPEQIAAVRDFVLHTSAEHSADDVARAFKGAKAETVADLLESLVALGVAVTYDVGGERRWRSARFVG